MKSTNVIKFVGIDSSYTIICIDRCKNYPFIIGHNSSDTVQILFRRKLDLFT
jgi:hypothetical protein